MITFATNAVAIKQLAKVLENDSKEIRKDIRVALSKTSKHIESLWAKQIVKELATAQKNIKKLIKQEVSRPDAEVLEASVSLIKSKRLPLKEFKARQTRSGVSYRAYKNAGRSRLPSSFIIGKFGGNVFTRQGEKQFVHTGRYAGQMRQPIVMRFGPSPFDTTKKFDIPEQLLPVARQRLLEELTKRVRFRVGKKTGAF